MWSRACTAATTVLCTNSTLGKAPPPLCVCVPERSDATSGLTDPRPVFAHVSRAAFPTRRCSLQAAPLPLKKSSIPTLVTAEEYAELVRLFSEGLPLESQGRVRNVTLIGVNHIAALCAKKGRDERSIALLRGLSVELPRLWQLQLQAEEHAANQEVDLLLNDDIAEEEELETSLFAELHHMATFQEDADDEQKVLNLALSPVPASVQAELKAYVDCAQSPSPPLCLTALAFVAVSRVCARCPQTAWSRSIACATEAASSSARRRTTCRSSSGCWAGSRTPTAWRQVSRASAATCSSATGSRST